MDEPSCRTHQEGKSMSLQKQW